MKPINEVCSYEQAVKLGELGIEDLETLFVYGKGPDNKFSLKLTFYCDYCTFIPAYTASELMEMLPHVIDPKCFYFKLKINKTNSGYRTIYRAANCNPKANANLGCELRPVFKTLAQSLSDMLIWLLENKYIKPEDLR
jgi:hypothetical protein